MRAARPGVHEYELQAQIECVFRAHDGYPAYGTIVGAGAHGCVLPSIANPAKANDGDLVMVDAGAEIGGYAADLTRPFTAHSRLSPETRAAPHPHGHAPSRERRCRYV